MSKEADSKTSSQILLHVSLYCTLKARSKFYPNFHSWYWDKLLPGMDKGENKIFLKMENLDVVACVVAKKVDNNPQETYNDLDYLEQKISLIWAKDGISKSTFRR